MASDELCVAVFKCKPNDFRKVLLDFYKFVNDLEDVKSLHFVIRDRIKDDVVFSFRVLADKEKREIISSKMAYKLGMMLPSNKFAVDPDVRHSLRKYVVWSSEWRVNEYGQKKFTQFCFFLSEMSKLVIKMMKKGYFNSAERVEIAHVMSWMLGCTEYGLLSKSHMEVGYYDRIENRYSQYLKQEFAKQRETSK